jgi:hypothetical protein
MSFGMHDFFAQRTIARWIAYAITFGIVWGLIVHSLIRGVIGGILFATLALARERRGPFRRRRRP